MRSKLLLSSLDQQKNRTDNNQITNKLTAKYTLLHSEQMVNFKNKFMITILQTRKKSARLTHVSYNRILRIIIYS